MFTICCSVHNVFRVKLVYGLSSKSKFKVTQLLTWAYKFVTVIEYIDVNNAIKCAVSFCLYFHTRSKH